MDIWVIRFFCFLLAFLGGVLGWLFGQAHTRHKYGIDEKEQSKYAN
jgi:hypothetical protein